MLIAVLPAENPACSGTHWEKIDFGTEIILFPSY